MLTPRTSNPSCLDATRSCGFILRSSIVDRTNRSACRAHCDSRRDEPFDGLDGCGQITERSGQSFEFAFPIQLPEKMSSGLAKRRRVYQPRRASLVRAFVLFVIADSRIPTLDRSDPNRLLFVPVRVGHRLHTRRASPTSTPASTIRLIAVARSTSGRAPIASNENVIGAASSFRSSSSVTRAASPETGP